MSDKRIKPCPCCESTDVGTEFVGKMEYVICRSCGLQTLAFFEKGQAIKRWNTRKPMERIVERLEERASAHERIMLGCANVEERHLHCRISDEYKQAIEIVKGGGVDE